MSSRACLRCISKKRKCDHKRPSCGLCSKLNLGCEYPPPQARRGPVAGLGKKAEARVQQCENALWWVLAIPDVADLVRRHADSTPLPKAPTAKLERISRADWWDEHGIRSGADVLAFLDSVREIDDGSEAGDASDYSPSVSERRTSLTSLVSRDSRDVAREPSREYRERERERERELRELREREVREREVREVRAERERAEELAELVKREPSTPRAALPPLSPVSPHFGERALRRPEYPPYAFSRSPPSDPHHYQQHRSPPPSYAQSSRSPLLPPPHAHLERDPRDPRDPRDARDRFYERQERELAHRERERQASVKRERAEEREDAPRLPEIRKPALWNLIAAADKDDWRGLKRQRTEVTSLW